LDQTFGRGTVKGHTHQQSIIYYYFHIYRRTRELRAEQDQAYQESLQRDRERVRVSNKLVTIIFILI
jgi:hypothetical protein